jgi:hypothetical protein
LEGEVKRIVIIGAVTVLLLLSSALALGCQDKETSAGADIPASDFYRLTTDANKDEDPFMLQDSSGVYWLVWCSDRSGNGDIWSATSPDGLNWSNPEPLTVSTFDDWHPSLVQDAAGGYRLAWMSWRLSNYDIWYSDSGNGVDWTEPMPVAMDVADDWVPSLSRDSSGAFWVTWSSAKSGNPDIWYSKSQDGISWSSAAQLTTDAAEDNCPWLLQDADGSYWIIWHSNRNGSYDVFYSKSTDGANWSAPVALITDESIDMYPFMLQDRQGRYWLVWTSDRSDAFGDIWYCYSEDGGEWSAPGRLTDTEGQDYTARLMEDASGVIWVSWVSDSSGNLDIWYAKMAETR